MSANVPTSQPSIRFPSGPIIGDTLLKIIEADRWRFATGRSAIFSASPVVQPAVVQVYYRTRVILSTQGPGRLVVAAVGQDIDVTVTVGGSPVVLPIGATPALVTGTVIAPALDTWYDLEIEVSAVTGGTPTFSAIYNAEDNLTTGDLPP
jgi:hypothetical protein